MGHWYEPIVIYGWVYTEEQFIKFFGIDALQVYIFRQKQQYDCTEIDPDAEDSSAQTKLKDIEKNFNIRIFLAMPDGNSSIEDGIVCLNLIDEVPDDNAHFIKTYSADAFKDTPESMAFIAQYGIENPRIHAVTTAH
jgi:hypothetical protein